eukprot:scaffold7197_cov88-Skeletonema_menzelii.AAC.8
MPKRKSGSKTKGGCSTITKSSNKNVKRATDNQSNLQIGGVAGLIAVAVALIGNRLVGNSGDNINITSNNIIDTSDLLNRVQKSSSFQLKHNRTLIAIDDIPSQTVLMEIPRELMIWDLDAVRNEFIREEILLATIPGTVAKRAALLSAYLALLRNDFSTDHTLRLQSSVAKQLPSYDEYKAFHPVLATIEQMELLLGKHSPAFRDLVVLRQSLNDEYDSFIATSNKFASLVSREDYLSCRLAVQSRAFQIPGVLPESEIPKNEQEHYTETIQIDFTNDGVLSIEIINDWMNSHINNNVMVGGYDAVKRRGRAWSTKAIRPGQELIMDYGRFHDPVLFGQYGYVPSDGTGVTIVSVAAYHDIGGDLPDLQQMMLYLQFDHGYPECIEKELHPAAFRLKELKARYLQEIAIDSSRWALPLPPRLSTDVTPLSTTILPDDYTVPTFDVQVYEYLEVHALSISLPCRIVTLTEKDLDNAEEFLLKDLETLEKTASPLDTPTLQLEELQVSPTWMIRTIHCMRMMASAQKDIYDTTIESKTREIMALASEGKSNTLEFNAAHVMLGEMQSQEALETWALDVLQSVSGLSPDLCPFSQKVFIIRKLGWKCEKVLPFVSKEVKTTLVAKIGSAYTTLKSVGRHMGKHQCTK